MQEAEDRPFRHERRELVLVVAPARDDDREVRKLLVDLGDERLGVVVGERGVDKQHGIAGGDHEVGRVRHVVGPPHAVHAGDGLAQEIDQGRVGRQHDDVRAVRARAGLLQRRVRAGRAGLLERRVRASRSAVRQRRVCSRRTGRVACTGRVGATGRAAFGSSGSGASSPGRMSE